jgi:hypothetical protein
MQQSFLHNFTQCSALLSAEQFVSSTLLLWWIQRNSPELRFFLFATRV